MLNANGTFIYTPAHDFNGSDNFSFKASDGTLDSSVATESPAVSAVNDAPTRCRRSSAAQGPHPTPTPAC